MGCEDPYSTEEGRLWSQRLKTGGRTSLSANTRKVRFNCLQRQHNALPRYNELDNLFWNVQAHGHANEGKANVKAIESQWFP